jgi:hypothetical protein
VQLMPTVVGVRWRHGEVPKVTVVAGREGGSRVARDLTLPTLRCTLQQDCANSSQPHFWTSASEGPSRCPSMAVLPAEIDVRQEYTVSVHAHTGVSRAGSSDSHFPEHAIWDPRLVMARFTERKRAQKGKACTPVASAGM